MRQRSAKRDRGRTADDEAEREASEYVRAALESPIYATSSTPSYAPIANKPAESALDDVDIDLTDDDVLFVRVPDSAEPIVATAVASDVAPVMHDATAAAPAAIVADEPAREAPVAAPAHPTALPAQAVTPTPAPVPVARPLPVAPRPQPQSQLPLRESLRPLVVGVCGLTAGTLLTLRRRKRGRNRRS